MQAAALPHGGRLSDGVNRWVFRRLPIAGQTASAHDVAREARVTAALQSTGVPVPPVISLCQDLAVIGAPFTITTWIDGEVIRERAELDQLVDEELRGACASMIDVLASLHAVDPNARRAGGLRPSAGLRRSPGRAVAAAVGTGEDP